MALGGGRTRAARDEAHSARCPARPAVTFTARWCLPARPAADYTARVDRAPCRCMPFRWKHLKYCGSGEHEDRSNIPLPDLMDDVSDSSGVRRGAALPFGNLRSEGAESISLSSAVTRPRSAGVIRSSRRTQPHQGGSISIPRVTALAMCGTSGCGGFGPASCMPIAWTARINPSEGHRFNFHKLLLDPFATAITRLPNWDFGPARGYDPSRQAARPARSKVDDAAAMPKCVFTHEDFHWHDDRPPRHPWSKTVIYETHVRGFTVHPNSGVEHPGTYRGLMEKIPYLKELGVTAVELMPVHEFNEHQVPGQSANRQATQELLGLRSCGFLRAEGFLQQCGRLGSTEAGVQGNGAGVPSCRYRSDPGCRVQSHGRGKRAWARHCVSAGLITRFSTCWRQTSATTGTTRVPAIPSTPTIPWCGTTS